MIGQDSDGPSPGAVWENAALAISGKTLPNELLTELGVVDIDALDNFEGELRRVHKQRTTFALSLPGEHPSRPAPTDHKSAPA
jgi:hypothetical protein